MTPTQVHPTAIVSTDAHLGEGVVIGPYAVIDDNVSIGRKCAIGPHAVIHRYVRMGERNHIHAHAVIGDLPQDLSFESTESWVEIGDENTLREGVTIHRALTPDSPTRIGSNCLLMAYAHVAHDCQVGDEVILTNNACLGGHVEIGDSAMLGGSVVVHQFVRVGSYVMVAGFVAVRKDVLPFCLLAGDPLRHYRLNTVGLRRAGITGERYRILEKAFRTLRSGQALNGPAESREVELLRNWLSLESKRGRYGFA